jgi:hypothetical protein
MAGDRLAPPTAGPPSRILSPLLLWWCGRAGLFVVVAASSYALALPPGGRIDSPGSWLLERFVWWDSFHYLRIVERGYLPPELPCCDQAFFPGYPLATSLLRPLVGGDAVWSGLLVTNLAASVAAVLLWRLAARSAGGDERVGRNAVILLAVTPFGIFLSSVYSEALFLALSLGAWLAGTERRWWLAGVLAAAASGVRINGLFLTAALAVMYLGHLRSLGRRSPRPDVIALALPAVVVAAYFGYLYSRTGSWTNWQEAQIIAWHRQVDWPWNGLVGAWNSLVSAPSNDLVLTRCADLVTAVGGIVLTVVLAVRRRFDEAVLIGLNLAVLICSTTLVSTPRYAVMWFPAYLMAARLSVRRGGQWVIPAALSLGSALLATFSIIFSTHLWVA